MMALPSLAALERLSSYELRQLLVSYQHNKWAAVPQFAKKEIVQDWYRWGFNNSLDETLKYVDRLKSGEIITSPVSANFQYRLG